MVLTMQTWPAIAHSFAYIFTSIFNVFMVILIILIDAGVHVKYTYYSLSCQTQPIDIFMV